MDSGARIWSTLVRKAPKDVDNLLKEIKFYIGYIVHDLTPFRNAIGLSSLLAIMD